jgi:hypothetical protein
MNVFIYHSQIQIELLIRWISRPIPRPTRLHIHDGIYIQWYHLGIGDILPNTLTKLISVFIAPKVMKANGHTQSCLPITRAAYLLAKLAVVKSMTVLVFLSQKQAHVCPRWFRWTRYALTKPMSTSSTSSRQTSYPYHINAWTLTNIMVETTKCTSVWKSNNFSHVCILLFCLCL